MGVGCACTTSDTHRFKTEALTLSAFVRARSRSHCCARNAFVCCWMLLLVALRALSAALELWCDNTASHAESVARASCGCIASTNFSNCALAFHPISDCLLTIIHRSQKWADKLYKKRNLGTWLKANPFAGSSHAKGIVLEKM